MKKTESIATNDLITKENYVQYVAEMSPKSAHLKNMFWAFLIGGLICVIGQGFWELYKFLGLENDLASGIASSTLVLIAAIMTGFGVYDRVGRFAGAGSTIPITGFSNAIVAPAVEFRAEGLIYGLGAKMFTVAGPVIVNGVMAAFIIATIRLIIGV